MQLAYDFDIHIVNLYAMLCLSLDESKCNCYVIQILRMAITWLKYVFGSYKYEINWFWSCVNFNLACSPLSFKIDQVLALPLSDNMSNE